MQEAIGIAVPAVALKTVFGRAGLIAPPVIGAVVIDEPFTERERLETFRGQGGIGGILLNGHSPLRWLD
jgi:hypothetical protein